jgi:hypothetical protein
MMRVKQELCVVAGQVYRAWQELSIPSQEGMGKATNAQIDSRTRRTRDGFLARELAAKQGRRLVSPVCAFIYR